MQGTGSSGVYKFGDIAVPQMAEPFFGPLRKRHGKRLQYYARQRYPPPRFRTLVGLIKPYIFLISSLNAGGGYLWGGVLLYSLT